MTFDEKWSYLLKLGVSEEALELVCTINGRTDETLDKVLAATTSFATFDQVF